MHYLLDTNVLSEPVKSKPDSNVLERMEKYSGQLVTASIVWHELFFACNRMAPSRKGETLALYIHEVVANNLPILPYDDAAAS